MKKKYLTLISCLALTGMLASCNQNTDASKECEHVWGSFKVTAPTETLEGKAEKACKLCDEKIDVTLPILSDPSYQKSEDSADCTHGGSITYTYQDVNYGAINFDIHTEAKGHDYVFIPEVEATKENIHGMKAYYKCSRCDTIFDNNKVELKDNSSLITNYYDADTYYHFHGDEKELHTFVMDGIAINNEQKLKCSVCDFEKEMKISDTGVTNLSTNVKFVGMDLDETIQSTYKLASGISLYATADKNCTFDGSYLKIGGRINPDSRFIKAVIEAPATITLRVKTAKASNKTHIGYYENEASNEEEDGRRTGFVQLSDELPKEWDNIVFQVSKAGTYLFGSDTGGYYINNFTVDYGENYHKVGEFVNTSHTSHYFACENPSCSLHFLEEKHSFGDAVIDEKGNSVYTCTVCGYRYSDAWQKDSDGHYKVGHEDNKEAHTYGEWAIDNEASYLTSGKKHRVCSVCEYEDIETIEPLGYGNLSNDQTVSLKSNNPSTITSEYKVADGILAVATNDKNIKLEATALNLGGAINQDSRYLMINATSPMKLIVKHACAKSGATATLALFNEKANEDRSNYLDGQTGEGGTTYITTTFSIPSKGTYYLGSLGGGIKIKEIQIETHSINNDIWKYDETSHYHASDDSSCTMKYDLADHTWDDGVTNDDGTTFTCTVCGKTKVESHHYSETYSSDENKHWLACTDEGCSFKKNEEEHSFEIDTTKTVKHASDTEEGDITYKCSVCNYEKHVTSPKLELGTLANGVVTPINFGTISWQEKLAPGIIVAGCKEKDAVKEVTYGDSSKLTWVGSVTEENKITTTGKYVMGGKVSGRYLKIHVSGPCTIDLYGLRNNKTDVYVGIAKTIEEIEGTTTTDKTFTSSNIQMRTYTLTEEGTYYIGSNTGSWQFVGLRTTYNA